MISFRKLNIDDITDVANLETNSFKDEGWSKEMLLDSLKSANTHFWGAFIDNLIVGYVAILLVGEDCDLAKICVLPKNQNQGIGEQLFLYAETESVYLGASKMILEVNAENSAAIALYKKVGFQMISKRKNYYSGKNFSCRDALVFYKLL